MRNEGFRARSHAHGQRQRRAVVHLGIGVLIVTAISLAAVRSASSAPSPMTMEAPPSIVYSGLAGQAAPDSDARFVAGGSHATHNSIKALTLKPVTAPVVVMRTSDAMSPEASLSTGVSAATASSGEASSGVQPLADLIDPRRPYALYTTQPGDTISSIAAAYGISSQTILDNNAEVSDGALILVGQQLLIPRAPGIIYTVGHGETLDSIIDQYENVTVDDVLAFRSNNISDPAAIETGRQLLLPNATPKPPPPPPPPPEPVVQPGGDSGIRTDVPAPPPSGGRFSLPVGAWNGVSDEFGTSRGAGSIHTGIDLDLYGFWGSPIFASCEGTVVRTEYLTYSYGYHVVIDCGDGWTTLYAHMSEIWVSPGEYVGQGQQIGISGNTGYSTGEHLHFEIRFEGAHVNPRDYLGF